MNRFSILQDKKECYVCGCVNNIHTHEVFFGKNRKKSIEDGCCVYLCGRHHNQSNEGVHFNHELDIFIKQKMETMWLKYYDKTIDDFIKRYGRNYYGITTYEYTESKGE
jgi:hypothetical protein